MKRQSQAHASQDAPAGPSSRPFPYADYVQAKNAILQALGGGRFYALVAGASGMGKTSLLRDIAADLDRHRHHLVYISSSKASLVGIVRCLAQTLHLSPRRSYLESVQVLADAIHAQTAQLLLWIDEADQVEAATLQEVRMLAECDLAAEPLVSVVLSGLPSLLAHLDAPSLFPLKRRIAWRCNLAGLRREELDPFLEHRFGTTEAQRLPKAVRDDLFERTRATPALIDTVVRLALSRNPGRLDADDLRIILDVQGL
jgi:type II secretory pathway predicted ATPase ExeA